MAQARTLIQNMTPKGRAIAAGSIAATFTPPGVWLEPVPGMPPVARASWVAKPFGCAVCSTTWRRW